MSSLLIDVSLDSIKLICVMSMSFIVTHFNSNSAAVLLESIKMRFLRSSNIFESFKLCFFCNKFTAYFLFSVKADASGKFTSVTTILDVLLFLGGLAYISRLIFTVIAAPLVVSSPSIIMELGLFFFAKFTAIHKLMIVLLNLYHRREWFQMLNGFHWIDEKVRFPLASNSSN